jgi:hypothetical protein
VISAAQRFHMSFTFDHDCAAMSADVRKAMQTRLIVDAQDERLIQTAFEEREGLDVSRRFRFLNASDELPAAREDLLFRAFVPARLVIDLGRQRFRYRDLVGDLNLAQSEKLWLPAGAVARNRDGRFERQIGVAL